MPPHIIGNHKHAEGVPTGQIIYEYVSVKKKALDITNRYMIYDSLSRLNMCHRVSRYIPKFTQFVCLFDDLLHCKTE